MSTLKTNQKESEHIYRIIWDANTWKVSMPVPPEDFISQLSIQKVQNGYIVRVKGSNCNDFKEPYLKPIMVFTSFKEMMAWIQARL